MTKKIYIKTWGCQMNEYDSSKMTDLLYSTHGYTITKNAEEADILLLNTCSIREKAQEKLFHQLGRWRVFKKNNKNVIIGVGGCVASQEGEYILKRANYVDIIFGPQTLHRIPEMIEYVYNTKNKLIDIRFPKLEKFDRFVEPKPNGPTAFVTIMEGCNKYCSFCIVPYTRGEELSRPFDDILLEVDQLVKQGVKEIHLIGQNVNAYRYFSKYENRFCTFSELLRLIASIDHVKRIRFTTSHPIEFTDDVIDLYRDIRKLVSFVHLPVQSGSDRILQMMQRGYTIFEYKKIINKLKEVRPNIHISSDFIVGFPGETEKDFNETINLFKEINFDMSFSFLYSDRPGTPAEDINDFVTLKEKKKRLQILQKLINQHTMKFSRDMYGTIQKILVEGFSKKNDMELSGRTENNRIVNFKGTSNMIGQFIDVKIMDICPNSLRGIVI